LSRLFQTRKQERKDGSSKTAAGEIGPRVEESLKNQVDAIADQKINQLVEEKIKQAVQNGTISQKIEDKVKEQETSQEIVKIESKVNSFIGDKSESQLKAELKTGWQNNEQKLATNVENALKSDINTTETEQQVNT